MHTRPVALAIAVAIALAASTFFLVGSRPRTESIGPITVVDLPGGGFRVHTPAERPRFGPFPDAQPCLIDTVSCLELSPEPFAPCLLAVERCSGEWRWHPLVGRNAD